MLIIMTTFTVLKDLMEKNFLIKNVFTPQKKNETTGDNGERLDGHINDE